MKMTMKMKMTRDFKIAFLLLTGLISFTAFAQDPTIVPTGNISVVPKHKTGGIFDSILKAPVRSHEAYAASAGYSGRIQLNESTNQLEYHNGTEWVALSGNVDVVNTLGDLAAYSGKANTLFVPDTLVGGEFWHIDIEHDIDGVTYIDAIGKGTGVWVRQFSASQGLDIRWFGAIPNDGVSDSAPFNAASLAASNGYVKKVYNTTGVWNTAATWYLYGDVEYYGDGLGNTIVRNLPAAETGLSLITPLDGATVNPDIYTYRTMIATVGADYTVSDTIRNVKLHDLSIDWNGVNGGVNSVLPLAWVRIQDSEMWNVQIPDALPADLEDVNEERQGHLMLIGFAKNTDVHHNLFDGASDYEGVAIRYLSEENRIHHNYFSGDKPDSYHWTSHLLQFARPTSLVTSLQAQFGRTQVENNYVYDNEFHLVNNVLHAVTSHSSKGAYVNNNYVEFYPGTLAWGFKFFDGTTNFSAIGNTFNAVNANTNLFPATSRGVTNQGVTFIGVNSTSNHAEVFNGIIANNNIEIKNTTANAAAVPSYVAPIMGGNNISKGSNIIFSGNNISIDGYDNYAKPIFGLYGDGINLYGNTVKLSNPFTTVTSAGLQFLRIKDGKGINVYNNDVTGTSLGKGIVIDNTSFEDIIIDPVNYQCAVAGDILTTGLTNQNEITVKPLTVNNTKADANGNITIAVPTVDTVLTDGSGNAISNNAVVDGLAGKLNITAASTDVQLAGGGTVMQTSLVRSQTISSDPTGGSTANLVVSTNFREAVWMLENKNALKANIASPTFTGTVTSPAFKISALQTAPSSATDTGTLGEIRITSDFIYICTATNTWKRVAISTW